MIHVIGLLLRTWWLRMAEIVVDLPPLVGGQAASWAALVELAPAFTDNWLLVGGQMVFLHEVERRAIDVRPTVDIDVVVDLRAEPAGLARIHALLAAAGFEQDPPSPDGAAHRFRRGAATLDVLAPDNIGRRARLDIGLGRTIQAPGTRQAFGRSGTVTVEVDGVSAEIRRPDLIGALIGKAAAVTKITSQSSANKAKHFRDVDSLARLLGPDDRSTADLSSSERRLLEGFIDQPDLSDVATASLRLLLATSGNG